MAKHLKQILKGINFREKIQESSELTATGTNLKVYVINLEDEISTKESVLESIISIINSTHSRLLIQVMEQ